MDAKALLDQLLTSARALTEQGRDMAEEKLGVPETGEQRDAMLSGMGKGALAAGALALLLGTGTGRRLTGSAVKLGSLAALGTVAYKAFENWQAGSGGVAGMGGTPISSLDAADAQARSELLIEAMIMAANADGHINAAEQTMIEQKISELGMADDAGTFIQEILRNPTSVEDLAERADSPEASAEIYLVSRLVVDRKNPVESAYLQGLVEALDLAPELVAELEAQVADA